jgi:cystathionine gamma-synthase
VGSETLAALATCQNVVRPHIYYPRGDGDKDVRITHIFRQLNLDTANPVDAMDLELGTSLPPGDPHGVSVSLPRWQDTVSWANRDKRVIERMKTGYPRFFVPLIVRELASKIVNLALSSSREELDIPFSPEDAEKLDALLVPTRFMATECQKHLQSHAPDDAFLTVVLTMKGVCSAENYHETSGNGTAQIYAVMFKGSTSEGEAKAFWQHTGFGISSRCASYWLTNASCFKDSRQTADELPQEHALCEAQSDIRKRIANLLTSPAVGVTERDVWLFHTGMSAIAHSAYLLSDPPDSAAGVAFFG